ncbi:MarR family transcriptional regulator [Streptomyces sp. NBC_01426]|uniref:MarR family winged helix-turn-helix transcriptional regulator n=1 Tax=unclassified Streptomyces TaxID=2593676 RepID=UPI002E37F9E9|nr:MarR family transcriptional regulator [Streptomyces sp. NBC_01426]
MPPLDGPPGTGARASVTIGAVAELLEVLLARGQDATTPAISPSQLRALLVVEQSEGINLRTLGAMLGSRPPSVTRLCDRMEAMGLLTRSRSRTSGREVELYPTRQGRALLDEYRAIRLRELSAVLDRMEPAGIEALVVGLTGLRQAAEDLAAGARAAAAGAPVAAPGAADREPTVRGAGIGPSRTTRLSDTA